LSDNKVLKKLLIGYANICSSVQDHRQNFLRPFIGSEWTKENKEIEQKGSLKASEEELLLKLEVLLKT